MKSKLRLTAYFLLFQLAALTAPCPMKTGTAALPSVLVLKEREIVKRTPNALVT